MVETTETIVAIATPPGRGAIGIVRVSGPLVKNIIAGLIQSSLQPRVSTFCKYYDENSLIIDEGLAIFFPAPSSFTGEDVLEVYTHGSRAVLELIVKNITRLGAKLARPGEFTERAFHNNKLDLVQAEAVAALIDATSEQAVRSAVRSLEGEFSGRVNILLKELIKIRVYVESMLDFPEEETDLKDKKQINEKLQHCLTVLEDIRTRAKQGAVLKEGATAVIIGKPNAGKSTLLNKLAGRDTAIVTEIPGTTRDLIAEDIQLEGVPLHIIDTAGLRSTRNKIEQEGIRRARDTAELADIVILVRELDHKPDKEEQKIVDSINPGKPLVILNNKIDLFNVEPEIQHTNDSRTAIFLSAKTGEGIDLLVSHLKNILGVKEMYEDVFMARSRHLDALERVRQSLHNAICSVNRGTITELLAEDLRVSQQALGEITGEFASDDLLGEIFSTFCIGK